jgi:hypothetical protein
VSIPDLPGQPHKTSVEMWAETPVVRSAGKYQAGELVSSLRRKSEVEFEGLPQAGSRARREVLVEDVCEQ